MDVKSLIVMMIACAFICGCNNEKPVSTPQDDANSTVNANDGITNTVENSGKDVENMEKTFYDFTATTLSGETVSMDKYKGKVVLVVNTASKCGFTPQYAGLETLYEKYKDKGLVILGFPCNQFGGQEPGSSEEISSFCKLNYGVTFDMFEKIDVNGDDAHPLYKYLKDKLPGVPGKAIKWNFTKFLIDKDGNPVKRFASTTTPEDIEPSVKELL